MVVATVGVGAIVAMARTDVPAASAAPPAPYPLEQIVTSSESRATSVSDDGDIVLVNGFQPGVLHRRTGQWMPIEFITYAAWWSLTGDGTAALRVRDEVLERLDTMSGAVSAIDLHLPNGVSPGSVVADATGRWLAVTAESPTTLRSTVFLVDTTTGTQIDARAGFDDPWPQVQVASISGDGRFVAYTHFDTLTAWGLSQVYLFDRDTRTTTLLLPWSGSPTGEVVGPQVSRDGRFVTFLADASKHTTVAGVAQPAFTSPIPNYAIALYDIAAGTTRIIANTTDPVVALVSNGGRRVTFSNRTPPDSNLQRSRIVDIWEDGVVMPLIRQADGTAMVETNLSAMTADGSIVLVTINAASFLAFLPALTNVPPTSTSTTTRPTTTPPTLVSVTTTTRPITTTTTTIPLADETTTPTSTTTPPMTPAVPGSGPPTVIVQTADAAQQAHRLPSLTA